jgi:hypothetical protein
MAPSLRSSKESIAKKDASAKHIHVKKPRVSQITDDAPSKQKPTTNSPRVVTPFASSKKKTAWKTPTVIDYDTILPTFTVKAVVADFYVRVLGMPQNNHALSLIQQRLRFTLADRPWIVQVMEDVRAAYGRGEQYDYSKGAEA